MFWIDTIYSIGVHGIYSIEVLGSDVVYSLNSLPSVYIIERGPFGVQADISLRGLSFNQVKLHYKGFPMYDPQTGHHNTNIPLTEMDIGGFAVNSPSSIMLLKRRNYGGIIRLGGRGYIKGSMKYGAISLEGFRWDGYEFEYGGKKYANPAEYVTAFFDLEGKGYNVFGGYRYNAFSAKGFYMPPKFNANETTQVALLGTDLGILKFFTRWHQDQFNWRTGRNVHNTLNSWTEVSKKFSNFEIKAGGGGEYIKSSIVERRTGRKDTFRVYTYIYPSVIFGGEFWALRAALKGFYDNFSRKPFFEPYVFGTYKSIFINAYYSQRLPDFTEIFYQDPVNFGNPEIKAERILGFDIGLDGKFGNLRIFGMRFYDRIDWVKRGDKYYAENLDPFNILGFEAFSPKLKTKFLTSLLSVSLIYPILYTNDTLRYTPSSPRYRFSILTNFLSLRVENSEKKDTLLVFADLSLKIFKFKNANINCGIRNLLGTNFMATSYMTGMGRWYYCEYIHISNPSTQ